RGVSEVADIRKTAADEGIRLLNPRPFYAVNAYVVREAPVECVAFGADVVAPDEIGIVFADVAQSELLNVLGASVDDRGAVRTAAAKSLGRIRVNHHIVRELVGNIESRRRSALVRASTVVGPI